RVPNKPWKQMERDMAKLFGGKRFWSNSGEAIDVESEQYVAQCKHVNAMSLAEMCELAEMVEQQGKAKGKRGVLCVKFRKGQGTKSTTLIVQTEAVWRRHSAPRAGPSEVVAARTRSET